MSGQLSPKPTSDVTIPERQQAAILEGLLTYSPQLTPRQRQRLVASIMRHPPVLTHPGRPRSSGTELLLRPGVVQAEALALNYALLLGLDLSGSLQYSTIPVEATLLAVNYLVLTGLMMALSLLCLVHALARWEVRNVYRALVVAMGVTGAFGMLESMIFSAPWPIASPLRALFLVTVPLVSVLVALMSMARGVMERAEAPDPPALAERAAEE
jgi:hypothetical protein